jgi:hypothetical protein
MNLPTITTLANSSTCLVYTYNSEENLFIGTFEDELNEKEYSVQFSYEDVANQMGDIPAGQELDNLEYLQESFYGKGEGSDEWICDCIGYALDDKVCFGSLSLFKSSIHFLYGGVHRTANYYLDAWLEKMYA